MHESNLAVIYIIWLRWIMLSRMLFCDACTNDYNIYVHQCTSCVYISIIKWNGYLNYTPSYKVCNRYIPFPRFLRGWRKLQLVITQHLAIFKLSNYVMLARYIVVLCYAQANSLPYITMYIVIFKSVYNIACSCWCAITI